MAVDRRKFLAASAGLAAAPFARLTAAPPPGPSPMPVPAADWSRLVAGNTAFGLDLYGQLRSEPGNLFLSPFSISVALGMTAAGARGKTREEMTRVLHLPDDAPAAFGAVLRSLNEEPDPKKRGFTLTTANALWAQTGYPWRPEYKKLVAEAYLAGLYDVDFASAPEPARATINAWVEKETRQKIRELLPPRSITPLTRLVLTNAIYFKGDWQNPFEKSQTKDLPFTRADGTKVPTPLMYRVGGYGYLENDTFQVLQLPYAGRRISMVVILPRKPDGLPVVEKELIGPNLTTLLNNLGYEREVHVHLPRFKVEQSFTLNQPLQALGMKSAFAGADFSGMHTGPEQLDISAVIHKAFVDVNEEGTEAAAATGVIVGVTSVAPAPPQPKYFRADRPFLFLIRDQKTGSILFMGRLVDPRS